MFNILKKMFRTFVIEEKLIFSLFCICQIVSILCMVFVSGVIASRIEYNNSFDLEYRQFSIELGKTTTSIEKLVREFEQLRKDNSDIDNATIWIKNKDVLIKSNLMYQEPSPLYIDIGNYFTKKNISSKENVILINQELTQSNKVYEIGDYLKINNKRFRVVGAFSNDYFEIPIHCVSEIDEILQMDLVFKKPIDKWQLNKYEKVIKETFKPNSITLPKELPMGKLTENIFQNVSVLFIALLAILNFSFLYSYLLNKRKYQYAVFRLCGCSTRLGSFLLIVELLSISLILYIICGLLFHICFSWIYPFMSENISYALNFSDYIEVAAVYILVLLLVFIPIIIKYGKKTPIEIYKGI